MLNPQEALRKDIEKIEDEETIERISIFVAGILTQQGIEKTKAPPITGVASSFPTYLPGGSTPPPALPPVG